MKRNDIPEALRAPVWQSVALLGDAIRHELGEATYRRIETIRTRTATLRGAGGAKSYRTLANAYRDSRLKNRRRFRPERPPKAIIFVLTPHPTEARSPDNIALFHDIQKIQVDALATGFEDRNARLRHLLEVVWKLSIERNRKPGVEDEAEPIYSVLLRPENLTALLEAGIAPQWVHTVFQQTKPIHPATRMISQRLRSSLPGAEGTARRRWSGRCTPHPQVIRRTCNAGRRLAAFPADATTQRH